MKWWIWVVLGLWTVALVGLGCSPTADDGGNGDDPINPYTPDGLLKFFANAYADKDLDAYTEALHDEFLFVFTQDIADSLGLPPGEPWWGKTKDVGSTGKMFDAAEVTQIKMDYVSVDPWTPIDIEQAGETYSGVFSRVIPDISVTIETQGQEPLILVVHDSYLDVVVVRDPNFPEQVRYVFLKIEEIPQTPT